MEAHDDWDMSTNACSTTMGRKGYSIWSWRATCLVCTTQ